MKSRSILVVDDDPRMRRLLRRCFEGDGFLVFEAERKADVLRFLAEEAIDLITLDIGLGHESGLTIAQDIRKVSDVPIIIVTAKDDVIDRVVGLEIGADDYICKPFHVRELIARVHALLRRAEHHPTLAERPSDTADAEAVYRFGDLTFDPGTLELRGKGGDLTDMTTADIKLLTVFLQRPKRALSRDQIMTLMNGQSWSPLDRTIDNQIARLRKKLERDPSHPDLIKTIRGVGYMLATDVRKEPA